ncbi:MAG: hypothetical protein LBN07_04365 [Christensenellaceae bacterium]|jgi:hypothetical protein|nr:hypothetical protein [Christensenellaceae bacterium]
MGISNKEAQKKPDKEAEWQEVSDEEFALTLAEIDAEKEQFVKDIKSGKKQWSKKELTQELLNHQLSADELKLVLNKYGDSALTMALQENPNLIDQTMKDLPTLSREQVAEMERGMIQYNFLCTVLTEKKKFLGPHMPYNKKLAPGGHTTEEVIDHLAGEYVYLDEQISFTTKNTDENIDQMIKAQIESTKKLKETAAKKGLVEKFAMGLDYETVCADFNDARDFIEANKKHSRKNKKSPATETELLEKQLKYEITRAAFYQTLLQVDQIGKFEIEGTNLTNENYNIWAIDDRPMKDRPVGVSNIAHKMSSMTRMPANYNFHGTYLQYAAEMAIANELMAMTQTFPPKEQG